MSKKKIEKSEIDSFLLNIDARGATISINDGVPRIAGYGLLDDRQKRFLRDHRSEILEAIQPGFARPSLFDVGKKKVDRSALDVIGRVSGGRGGRAKTTPNVETMQLSGVSPEDSPIDVLNKIESNNIRQPTASYKNIEYPVATGWCSKCAIEIDGDVMVGTNYRGLRMPAVAYFRGGLLLCSFCDALEHNLAEQQARRACNEMENAGKISIVRTKSGKVLSQIEIL